MMQRIGNARAGFVSPEGIDFTVPQLPTHHNPNPSGYSGRESDESGFLFAIPLVKAAISAVHAATQARHAAQQRARVARHEAKKALNTSRTASESPVINHTTKLKASQAQAEAERLQRAAFQAEAAEDEARTNLEQVRAQARRRAALVRLSNPHSEREAIDFARQRQELQRQELRDATPEDRAAALWSRAMQHAWTGIDRTATQEKDRRDAEAHRAFLHQLGIGRLAHEVDVGALFVDTDGYQFQHGSTRD